MSLMIIHIMTFKYPWFLELDTRTMTIRKESREHYLRGSWRSSWWSYYSLWYLPPGGPPSWSPAPLDPQGQNNSECQFLVLSPRCRLCPGNKIEFSQLQLLGCGLSESPFYSTPLSSLSPNSSHSSSAHGQAGQSGVYESPLSSLPLSLTHSSHLVGGILFGARR